MSISRRRADPGRARAVKSCVEGDALLRLRLSIVFLCTVALFASASARGDVGLVLNESIDTSLERITGSGHSAVYLSRICPETPVKLRLCRPNEQGSVVSNYTTLGEDQPFEWNIVPLNVFVYGVADPASRPIFSTWKVKRLLEQNYREQVLGGLCEGHSCQTSGGAEWREMVSASSERTLYILVVSTTVEQDLKLIAAFNDAPNVNHFNGLAHNCADFTKSVINTYFPHAAHRDVMNDFGISSPKGIAHSFSHYAHGQPDAQYRVMHFAQLPGTIKRSSECRNGAEQLYRSKKLLIPMAVFAWHELPFVVGSNLLTGRFSVEHEFEDHSTIREGELGHEIDLAKVGGDSSEPSVPGLEEAKLEERVRMVGSQKEWSAYREKFDAIVAEAVDAHILADRNSVGHVFKDLNEKGTPFLDRQGKVWMKVEVAGKATQVGLSADELLAPGSDRTMAYKLMLAHVAETLKSPPRQRETMPEFIEAWDLMQQARPDAQSSFAAAR
jgi:hypothetical protein